MSKPGKKYPMHEIEETRAAGRDVAFDEILDRIKENGGKITEDETHPLYTEIGTQQFEVGYQRVVEFNLNRFDFQLTRNVETSILQGSGHQKHVEELPSPRTRLILKRKPDTSNDWQIVDVDDIL